MFGRFVVATKKKLGPQPAVFIHWENSRLDRPEAHPPCAVFLLYILSDGRCFIFMDGLRKDLARSSCTVTAIDDGRKKRSHGRPLFTMDRRLKTKVAQEGWS